MNEKQRIDSLLKENGLYAKKSFGQNFLINEGIIKRIVQSMEAENIDHVIEIGPGLGSLTLPLSEKAKDLIAVDADRDMVKILTKLFDKHQNVRIIQSDFLRFNPNEYSTRKNRAFIGNLPYNITSELLEYLLEKGFVKAGVMVQKEVYDKLDYFPNKKENSPLGAYIKAIGELSLVTLVDSSCFSPAPKVDSAFIKIEAKRSVSFSLYPVFKAFFRNPNKTIGNCLKETNQYQKGLLYLKENNSPYLSLRARQLEILDLVKLARIVNRYSN